MVFDKNKMKRERRAKFKKKLGAQTMKEENNELGDSQSESGSSAGSGSKNNQSISSYGRKIK